MNKRDIDILKGLWRWKLLSTAAIAELYFGKLAPSHAYRQLIRLRDRGLIEMIPIPGDEKARSFAWTLTPKGFRITKDYITKLAAEGFRSESIRHDSIVNAVHLGSWIFGIPAECALFSEQQLRRYNPDQYPKWIPQDGSHRSDGYWLTSIHGKQGTIALEVELNAKSAMDYRGIAQSYALNENLFRVVWVVPSIGMGTSILEAMQEMGKAVLLHSFLLLKDFKVHGWNAKFFTGRDVTKSLCDLLPSEIDTSAQHVAPKLLLDFRKSPHRSQCYAQLKKNLKSHRLGSPLVVPTPISNVPKHLTEGEAR